MSVLEIEKQIAALSPAEVEEVAQGLAAFRQEEYPSQKREQMPEGYIGSVQHQADRQAIDEGFKDFEEGRYSTLAEWAARTHVRYGITENTKPFTPEELDALP